ncbi:carboxylesterase family protein [Pseudarthrobacter sp. H2]|uniref:carboxylesterase family protein n=1 Tax=Pseudarthrobacter sp. H2 TaxID=3418415 RepID=UPI003CF67EC4
MRTSSLTVQTTSGLLTGTAEGGVRRFLGIPYAVPPVGDRRFAKPEPMDTPRDARTATGWGSAPPQSRSRLEDTMGPMPLCRQSEDCLQLNVWTPDRPGEGPWPVMVWIHGGGYLFGSAATPWYDGSVLAKENGVVVVTVGFRLGILGYYGDPGHGVANLGLEDQMLALDWIRHNIAAFGGAEDNITLAGQSSGAHSIVAMASVYAARREIPYHRMMLLSAPMGMGVPYAPANASTPRVAGGLSLATLRELAAGQIIALQDEAVQAGHRWGKVAWPFQLCVDGNLLPTDPFANVRFLEQANLPLLVMWTTDEGATHFAPDEKVQDLSAAEVQGRLLSISPGYASAYEREVGRASGVPPVKVLADMIGDDMYTAGSLMLVDRRHANEVPTVALVFNVKSDAYGGRLGAGHATDLPYVFGNYNDWKRAPSLTGISSAEFDELSRKLRARLEDFMRTPAGDVGSTGSATADELSRNGWTTHALLN